MTNTVKVWNDHSQAYSEVYKENTITIPPKGFIEMDYFDAVGFLGQFVKPKKAGENFVNQKMLRIEGLPTHIEPAGEHKCQMCKGKFPTEADLMAHSDEAHKANIIKEEHVTKRRQ